MRSVPRHTSRAEGFRSSAEISALRPVPVRRPKLRRVDQPAEHEITTGIVCFCGQKYTEDESLEFMIHLRAEVGQTLEWANRRIAKEIMRSEKYRRSRGMKPFQPAEHGTESGWHRHYRQGEKPCVECKMAHNERSAARRRSRGIPAARQAECGTLSGYSRHRNNDETPCDACKQACAEYSRQRRAARKFVNA